MSGPAASAGPPEALNIAEAFLDRRLTEGRGERVALRLAGRQLTYRQVQELANRFAQVLAGLGVRQEERVLIALPDGPEFVGALFGVLKLGAVAVMVNRELKPAEVEGIASYSRASAAVVDEVALPAWNGARRATRWPRRLLTAGVPASSHARFEKLAAEVDGRFSTVATHRDDPAIWLFSGGTTGRPKAVVQSHASFSNTTELYAKVALAFAEDDVTLSVPKLFFGYATGSNLFFPFAVGASAILFPERPTPAVLFAQIRRHRPTLLVNVPTMVHRMVSDPAAARQDLGCLRLATSAGEALPVELYHRWRQTFGVELLDGLGTAEMWHIFLTNRPGDVRPGTLGRVVPGFEVRVCDDEGTELPAGEVGRLWVRGGSRALGYWQDSHRTAQAFRGEWFVGGDLVRRDAEGYVTYCGRDDDVLKVGGRWLVPQEVEGCLLGHPAVADCAVVGVADVAGLTKPYAFVVAAAGAPAGDAELEQRLQAHVLANLQPYKRPRRVLVLSELPRTHLGKIDRGRLRRMVPADG